MVFAQADEVREGSGFADRAWGRRGLLKRGPVAALLFSWTIMTTRRQQVGSGKDVDVQPTDWQSRYYLDPPACPLRRFLLGSLFLGVRARMRGRSLGHQRDRREEGVGLGMMKREISQPGHARSFIEDRKKGWDGRTSSAQDDDIERLWLVRLIHIEGEGLRISKERYQVVSRTEG